MRTLLLALAVALVACGESGPTSTVCGRANVDNACTQPTTAEPIDRGGWYVILRMTVTDRVEYSDGGHQCSYTRKRCVTTDCFFDGASFSRDEAILRCKDIYEGH